MVKAKLEIISNELAHEVTCSGNVPCLITVSVHVNVHICIYIYIHKCKSVCLYVSVSKGKHEHCFRENPGTSRISQR